MQADNAYARLGPTRFELGGSRKSHGKRGSRSTIDIAHVAENIRLALLRQQRAEIPPFQDRRIDKADERKKKPLPQPLDNNIKEGKRDENAGKIHREHFR